ncbi:MAG: RNA polymerase sigma factor [bacterium]
MADHNLNLDQEADETLIKKVALKDEFAFRTIFNRYEHKIFNLIYRYIGSYHEAEELTQDVFVKIYKAAKTFKGKARFSTWLYRITVNVCKKHRMKKRLILRSLDDDVTLASTKIAREFCAPESTMPDKIFKQKQKMAIIQNAVDTLPANQKIAFILSKYESYSYAEIAVIMHTSISAVESLLVRAKRNLKKELMPFKERGEI